MSRYNKTNKFRSTNFQLGDFPSDFQTMNNKNYYDKFDSNNTQQAFRSVSQKLHLGSDKLDQQTTNNVLTENHPKTAPQDSKDHPVKSELSKHHFLMGNDSCDQQSVFTSTIGRTASQVMDMKLKPERRKSMNTRTNFILGKDKEEYKTTQADQSHSLSHGKLTSLPQKDKALLQSTHFALGSDKHDWKSTSQANYYKKKSDYLDANSNAHMLKTDLKSSHFLMGNNKDPWRTVTQESYVDSGSAQIDKSELDQRKKDLRNSNITLGNDNVSYRSETVEMLESLKHSKTINKTAGIAMNSGDENKKSHLNFMRGEGHYETNQNTHQSKDPNVSIKLGGNPNLKKDLTSNHFTLGYQNVDIWQTENRTQFQQRENPNDLKGNPDVNNRKYQSFKISYDPNNCQETSSKTEYYDKSKMQSNSSTKDNKPTQKTNFSLGNDPNNYTTDAMTNFTQMGTSNESKHTAQDLKKRLSKSSFALGNQTNDYRTSAKDQMTWKQPVVRFED